MNVIHLFTIVLVLLGGINFGFIGLTGTDVFVSMFGTGSFTTVLYVLVTLSTLYHVFPMLMTHITSDKVVS